MRIGGLQKISLIDFPGVVSCVIFTQGCNFRCPYCHNSDLVVPALWRESLSQESILKFLQQRVGKLQGVVITGGEPTMQDDLIFFIEKIKQLKYAVKLDTNGSFPNVLEELLAKGSLDYVAMDVKASIKNYDILAGCAVDIEKIKKSIALIMNAGIPYEFRTTWVRPLHQKEEWKDLSILIKGARKFVAQGFQANEKILSKELLDQGHFTDKDIEQIQFQMEQLLLNQP